MGIGWLQRHRGAVRVLSALTPLAISGTLHLAVEFTPKSSATLLLVVLVLGAGATGDRPAGVLAAVASSVGFDFFLTRPYLQLRIDSVEDVEFAVLILLVGLAVSGLASWGLGESAKANQRAEYIKSALESADLAAGSTHLPYALERVADSIGNVLGVDQVSFESGCYDAEAAVINRDGTLRYHGRTVDLCLAELPTGPNAYIAIPVVQRATQIGYFRIATPTCWIRPTREQLRVAILLAGEWSLRALSPR